MMHPGWHAYHRLRRLRLVLVLVLTVVIWSVLDALRVRNMAAVAECQQQGEVKATGAFITNNATVFIAALHWNNEELLRDSWVPGVTELVDTLGGRNRVFVSVLESGSWDGSKAELRRLDGLLADRGVPRRIVLEETTHQDAIRTPPYLDAKDGRTRGWIQTSADSLERRRIPYLADLRNRVLEPLLEQLNNSGKVYDRILFLGDVVFTIDDILMLLATRQGNYAAACGLDFSKPPQFYDTFALRDSDGHETASHTWPYFRARTSRVALQHGQPVPVRSCWNGIVVMDSAPFYEGLLFRAIPDHLAVHHLEGSECCLIHADNPRSATAGVWLNPNVRVGYSRPAFDNVHPADGTFWMSAAAAWTGLWKNRFLRTSTTPWFKERAVAQRQARWQAEDAKVRREPGGFCLINEMQVLVGNGWAHRD